MSSFNRIIIMGNLTRDPDFKQLASGQSVCRLSLASNRQFKNRQTGQLSQEVCYIDIDVWGPQADTCFKFLTKGRPVLVEGRLKFDSWEDQEGKKQSRHSIVADRVTFIGAGGQAEDDTNLESGASEIRAEPIRQTQAARSARPATKPTTPRTSQAPSLGEIDFKDEAAFDDDLPF